MIFMIFRGADFDREARCSSKISTPFWFGLSTTTGESWCVFSNFLKLEVKTFLSLKDSCWAQSDWHTIAAPRSWCGLARCDRAIGPSAGCDERDAFCDGGVRAANAACHRRPHCAATAHCPTGCFACTVTCASCSGPSSQSQAAPKHGIKDAI